MVMLAPYAKVPCRKSMKKRFGLQSKLQFIKYKD
jgi:hypothetical protein